MISQIKKFFAVGTNDELSPVVAKKNYDREFGVSPIFSFSNASTIATGTFHLIDIEVEKPSSAKYSPFNIVEVTNTSNFKVKMYPNQDRTRAIVIPAGVTKTLTQDTIRFVRTLLFENAGTGTIAANELDVIVQRDTTNVDSIAKSAHALAYGKGGMQ